MASPRGQRSTRLNEQRIVACALELVEEQGLDALTMRALGSRLGVDAMAIYHHVPNKAALFDAMVAAIWEELEMPPEDAPWRQRLREMATRMRALFARHAAALPLIATRSGGGPGVARALERGVAALEAAGADRQEAFAIVSAASSWVIGHALAEVGRPPEGPAESDQPAPAGNGLHDAESISWDERFDTGVNLLIAGIEATVENRGRSG